VSRVLFRGCSAAAALLLLLLLLLSWAGCAFPVSDHSSECVEQNVGLYPQAEEVHASAAIHSARLRLQAEEAVLYPFMECKLGKEGHSFT